MMGIEEIIGSIKQLENIKYMYKFYILDTYDSPIIYVHRDVGIVNVKESLHYGKVINLALSALNLTSNADEIVFHELDKYNINFNDFVELMIKGGVAK